MILFLVLLLMLGAWIALSVLAIATYRLGLAFYDWLAERNTW